MAAAGVRSSGFEAWRSLGAASYDLKARVQQALGTGLKHELKLN